MSPRQTPKSQAILKSRGLHVLTALATGKTHPGKVQWSSKRLPASDQEEEGLQSLA